MLAHAMRSPRLRALACRAHFGAKQRSAAQRSAAQEIGRAASLPHSTEALEAKVDDELRRWYGLPLLL
jgi:hypothetical protein